MKNVHMIKKISLVLSLLFAVSVTAQVSSVQILSGLEKGTYNELSNDIQKSTTVPIKVLTSGGSAENFNRIISEQDINLTFVQYDLLLDKAKEDPMLKKKLMIFLPLFLDEEIHLVTLKDSKISALKGLSGKKVGIGSKEQGTRSTALIIKEKMNLAWTDVEISSNDAMAALLKGEIDAFFYVGGAPINMLETLPAETQEKIKLVSIQDKLLTGVYTPKSIAGGTYAWQKSEVKTYAVTLLLMMNANASKPMVAYLAQVKKDIMKSVATLQTEGHAKWKTVYYQNSEIRWPYYYFAE